MKCHYLREYCLILIKLFLKLKSALKLKINDLEIKIIYKKINKLGEGPLYDKIKDLIYWVDIENKKIYASKTFEEKITHIDMPEMVSAVFLTNKEEIIASAGHSLYLIDSGKKLKKLAEIENDVNTRFNDGKVSPDGLIIVGTMDLNQKRPIGSLYSFNGKIFKKILKEDDNFKRPRMEHKKENFLHYRFANKKGNVL